MKDKHAELDKDCESLLHDTTITVSECLSEHNQCSGEYLDSIGFGLIISCACPCHQTESLNR
jgi:hypothetical protein